MWALPLYVAVHNDVIPFFLRLPEVSNYCHCTTYGSGCTGASGTTMTIADASTSVEIPGVMGWQDELSPPLIPMYAKQGVDCFTTGSSLPIGTQAYANNTKGPQHVSFFLFQSGSSYKSFMLAFVMVFAF